MDYITKTHKTKEGVVVSTKYCISPDFKPAEVSDICPEFIESYVVANREEKWFVAELSKEAPDKNGKIRPASFMNLRKAFVEKFFPEIIKGATTQVSWRDQMLAKYSK